MDFELDTIQWLDTRVNLNDYLDIDVKDKYLCDDTIDAYVSEILESKYRKVLVDDVAAKQEHLTKEQQIKLCNMLHKHKVLFDGKLGCYPHKQFHLDLIVGAELVHCKRTLVTQALIFSTTKNTTYHEPTRKFHMVYLSIQHILRWHIFMNEFDLTYDPVKMDERLHSPYPILETRTNEMVVV